MFRIIPTSSTGIYTRFGKFKKIVEPGLTFKVPFVDQIHIVSNKLEQHDFEFKVPVKDGTVNVAIAVKYQINQELSDKAFYKMKNPYDQLRSLVESVIRNEMPTKTVNDVLISQEYIATTVSNKLKKEFLENGFELKDTLITNIQLPKEIEDARNKVTAAEKLREAAVNESEANYITVVRQAEADKERKRLQGEGISAQRLAILSGYEDSIQKMQEQFDLTPEQLVNFVITTQHLDTLEAIGKSTNCKVIFLNHEPNARLSAIFNDVGKEGISDSVVPYGSVSNLGGSHQWSS